MKAIAKTKKEKGLQLIDVREPTAGLDEVIVEIKAASICGTDVHIYDFDQWAQNRLKNTPLILGHELAGAIVEKGKNAKKIKIGDKVAFESHIFCGKCETCLSGCRHLCDNLKILGIDTDGGFRKYINAPEKILFKMDFDLRWETMALMEPFGNALYCASPSGEKLSGKKVLIMGDGPAGILAAVASRALDAENILLLGKHSERLTLARAIDIDVLNVLDGEIENRIFAKTRGAKFDIGLEMSGAEIGFHQLLKLTRKGGRISAFGLIPENISLNLTDEVIFQGITIQGINGRRIPETWNLAKKLLREKKVDFSRLITHRFALDQFEEAFNIMKRKECGKVIFLL